MRIVLYCTTCRYGRALIFGRDAFRIRSIFVWVSFEIRSGCLPSCSPPCMHAGRQQVLVPVRYFIPRVFVHLSYQGPGVGRTVLYCTTCTYGSPHCRTGFVRDTFEIRLGFVRDSFGMPAFLPASGGPPCMRVGRTVLYCTTCRYGNPHFSDGMRSVCFRNFFGMRSICVRYAFGMPAFLPASLHACRQ